VLLVEFGKERMAIEVVVPFVDPDETNCKNSPSQEQGTSLGSL
jgi:hypothetical protein